jgi:hypothetical protein
MAGMQKNSIEVEKNLIRELTQINIVRSSLFSHFGG